MKIAVTGAFGYSGRYIAERLLAAGHTVITLTNSLHRQNPFGPFVQAVPFNFDHPERLTHSLQGMDALINTYWVRFNHHLFTHEQAVANTKILFESAQAAGVGRVVHISITHPDIHSDLPYFRGKAELEQALQSSKLSYCILRPTVLFGKEDILINNIAWSLRHLPVFGVFGDGQYKLQPIYVDDLAAICAEKISGTQNEILNAIGPETYTYRSLVEMIQRTLGIHRPTVGMPPAIGYVFTSILGKIMGDVIITRDEIKGLMQNRLYVDSSPLGTTKLSDWTAEHKDSLGRHYTSELARRTDRNSRYQSN